MSLGEENGLSWIWREPDVFAHARLKKHNDLSRERLRERERERERQAGRQADRQTDTNRRTDRQTDRGVHAHTP